MLETTFHSTSNSNKSSTSGNRNYANYLRKDEIPQTPRILLKNNTNSSTSVLTARNENMPPTSNKGLTGAKKFDVAPAAKPSSNIFSSSLSEFQKCPECDTVRRTSLDEWLSHLGANHPVPSSWPSARASTLEEAKQPHPYTSVVDSHKKRKNDSIPRPLNSFMIFAQYIRRLVLHSFPDAHNVHISQRIGELWRNMPAVLQASFREEASKLAELHAIEFPHYRYQPKKRNRTDSLIQNLPFSVSKAANIEHQENQHHHPHHNGHHAGNGPSPNAGRSWYYPTENASKWFVDKQMAQQQQQTYSKHSNVFSKRQNNSNYQPNVSVNTEKLSSNPSILNHSRRPRILIYKNSNSVLNNVGSADSKTKTNERLMERRLQQGEDSNQQKVANFDAPLTALVSSSNKKKNDSSQNLRQNLQINTNSQDSFTSKSTQDYLTNYSIDFAPTMLTTSPEVFMDDSNHFLNSYNFKGEMAELTREDDYHNHQPTGSSSTIECESLTDTFMMKEEMLSPLQSPYENQNSCFSDIDLLESSNLNEIPKANLFSMKCDDISGY